MSSVEVHRGWGLAEGVEHMLYWQGRPNGSLVGGALVEGRKTLCGGQVRSLVHHRPRGDRRSALESFPNVTTR